MRCMTQPAGGFDGQVAVEEGNGGFVAHLDSGWTAGPGAFGGYVAALMLRAAAREGQARLPRSISLQLLAPLRTDEPVLLIPDPASRGRTVSVVTVHAKQAEALGATAVVLFADSGEGPALRELQMPSVPPPQHLKPLVEYPEGVPAFLRRIEHRHARPPLPLSGGDVGELCVWMRLTEGRLVDATLAAFLADAAPPALFARLQEFLPIPTVDFSLHLAPAVAEPRSEWVLGRFRHRFTADGFSSEDGELWSPDGELLALSRQLRRVAGVLPELEYEESGPAGEHPAARAA